MIDTRWVAELLNCLLLPFFIVAVLGTLVGPAGVGILAAFAEGLQIVIVACCNVLVRVLEAVITNLPAFLTWSFRVSVHLAKLTVQAVIVLVALVTKK